MSDTFRVATFNVENLFSRAKILNLRNHKNVDKMLAKANELNTLIQQEAPFSPANKAKIIKLYQGLKSYLTIQENRGKLFNRKKTQVVAKSGKDWDGEIAFKRDSYTELGRGNTAKVLRKVNADIACIVEAEDRITLRAFDADYLTSRYTYEMLLDGNDRRGIDVGVYSKFPLGGIWTHMFDKKGRTPIFSRDCPEYEIKLPGGNSLFLLCNHLKSKGYDSHGTANKRRKNQARAIAKILGKYDLEKDLVVVAGDMNDTPDSKPLRPLLTVPNLHDVLELQFGDDHGKRWTYAYKREYNQIDYILVSTPLKELFKEAGVERRGINNLHKSTSSTDGIVPIEKEFQSVTHWTNAASDHGAVWADFSFS